MDTKVDHRNSDFGGDKCTESRCLVLDRVALPTGFLGRDKKAMDARHVSMIDLNMISSAH